MSKVLLLVFLLPLAVLGLVLSGLTLWGAFALLPAWLVWVALVLLAVAALWFFLSRRPASFGSESSLLRQTSKDGLL